MIGQSLLQLFLGRDAVAFFIQRQTQMVVEYRKRRISSYQVAEGPNRTVTLSLLQINVPQRIGKPWLARRLLERLLGQSLRFIQIAVIRKEKGRVIQRRQIVGMRPDDL